MEAVAEKVYTLEEYFTFCELHKGRFEYVNGDIIEIPGESVAANQIAGNIHRYLGNILEDQPYIFVQNTVKLQVKEGKVFRIPDFLIFKESGNQIKYATEPVLVTDVTSVSSEKTDWTVKQNEYWSIPSIQYYLIAEQESCLIEFYMRERGRWYMKHYNKMEESIQLPYFGIEIPISAVYKKVVFPAEYINKA